MTRPALLVLLLCPLGCSGQKGTDLAPNASAAAGLARVETGRPKADNDAALQANRTERDLILEVLKTAQPAAQACYAEGVARVPRLYGDLVARIDIQADGSVGQARVSRSTLRDDTVADCVVAALQELSFPEPSKDPLVVSYPFVFVSDLTPPEVVRALYIRYGFVDPADEKGDEDKRKAQASGEDGWYENW